MYSLYHVISKEHHFKDSYHRCVCKACSDDIKRHLGTSQYTPRWFKKDKKCAVPLCNSQERITACNLEVPTEVYLQLNITTQNTAPIKLCHQHYNKVHRLIHQEDYIHKKCTACTKQITGECRRFQDIELLSTYLSNTHNIHLDTNSNTFCMKCYNSFNSIMQDTPSTDANLKKIIDKLRETEPIDSSTCLELALIQSTLVVANHILTQHACLLSEIYEHFNHLYLKYLKNLSNQTFQKQSKKILHNYLINLCHHRLSMLPHCTLHKPKKYTMFQASYCSKEKSVWNYIYPNNTSGQAHSKSKLAKP